jgi:hypothetical protein
MGRLQAPPSPPRGLFGPGAAPAAIAQKTKDKSSYSYATQQYLGSISINVKFVPKGSEPHLSHWRMYVEL